jgi:hypothetical protein
MTGDVLRGKEHLQQSGYDDPEDDVGRGVKKDVPGSREKGEKDVSGLLHGTSIENFPMKANIKDFQLKVNCPFPHGTGKTSRFQRPSGIIGK